MNTKIMPCKHCGKLMQVGTRSKWASCPDCQLEMRRKRYRKTYIKKIQRQPQHRHTDLPVVMVQDALPTEKGGFPARAKFSLTDLALMLGSRHLTPGTILEVRGKRVQVDETGHKTVMEAQNVR